MKFFLNLKIFYKIGAPFIILIIGTALVAGPVARYWVVNRIKEDFYVGLKSDASGISRILRGDERRLKMATLALAQFPEVEKAISEDNVVALRRVAIPYKATLDIHFIEVLDNKGRVLANFGGPFPERWDLSNLNIVRRGFLEMNDADFLSEGNNHYLVSVAPIRSTAGPSGLILMGMSVDPAYLEGLFIGPIGMHVSIFEGKRLAVTTFKETKNRKELELPRNLAKRGLSEGAFEIDQREVDRIPYFFYYAPLYISNRSIGFLAVALDAQEVVVAERQVTANVILLNLLVIITMLGLAYVISNAFTPSIQKLLVASRKVAAGEAVENITVTTSDEIGQLANAFNQMLSSLKRQSEALTRRVLELSVLYDTSRVLSSSLDLRQSINTVLESTLKVFNADIGCMTIVDEETGELTSGICRANSSVSPEGRLYLERVVAERVIAEGKTIRFDRFTSGKAPLSTKTMGNIKSVLAVPINPEKRVTGAISAGNIRQIPFSAEDERLLVTLAGQTAVALENAKLFESLENAYLQTVKALAAAVDAKDSYTRGHSEQVAKYSLMIADELSLPENEKVAIETAAYLHDIGKIGIGDEILMKDGILDENEISIIRSHPLLGANILRTVTFPWKVVPSVLHHHEHYAGGGYPAGLKKREIPLGARILALSDAFDAITSDRPYRKARTMEEAVEEIKRCAGTQFDPSLVKIFLSTLKRRGFISETSAKAKGAS